MILKQIESCDIHEIKKFDVENISGLFSDPFSFNTLCVRSADKIVGAGIIRVVNEFKMVIDSTLPPYVKAKILKLLMEEAMKLKQCNEVIVSLTQPYDFIGLEHYKDLLIKHYNFEEFDNVVLRRIF